MNILILHRIPYHKIDYHYGIDHAVHDVTYFGKPELLDTLPAGLRHQRVERPGIASSFEEAKTWLQQASLRFDRIISLSEYELLDAARLREWLGMPGASVEQVTLVRDKIRMKQAAACAGLRVPRFLPLVDFLAQQPSEGWQGATVLKPRSGASSEDVVVFATAGMACEAIAGLRSGVPRLDSPADKALARAAFEVEEFIAGPILHYDGLIAGGEILALTASRYVNTCLDYANGKPLASFHFPVTDAALAWVRRALDSVGIREGSFHLEAIDSDGELVFLEVGNRVGGADVVATFELATGIHLPSQELRILLGENGPLSHDPGHAGRGMWHGWFVVPGHHLGGGYHAGIGGIAVFRNSTAVLRWNELAIGTALPTGITYQAHEVPLAGVIATASADETRGWFESLFESITLAAPAPAEQSSDPSSRAEPQQVAR
ncbi:ATP-grasp domain-containing protein [Verminephrobacter eiseniae]|uniref:ATP-grasp domain-containing protein n=1 Tax=Verminephrobacter eiseniae TaxID=364317 RepID=UPI0022389DF1|nr:ATP-grasp domain-containing protein [Verminephrobacter eiseniae]